MKKQNQEIIFVIVILLYAVIISVLTFGLDRVEAKLFPIITLLPLIFLSVWLLIILRKKMHLSEPLNSQANFDVKPGISDDSFFKITKFLLWMLICILGIYLLGFSIGGGLFIALCLRFYAKQRILVSIISGVVMFVFLNYFLIEVGVALFKGILLMD